MIWRMAVVAAFMEEMLCGMGCCVPAGRCAGEVDVSRKASSSVVGVDGWRRCGCRFYGGFVVVGG
jgi:hypothetical protein